MSARGSGGSIACRINAERILILSWPRAILLQLAHPLVAAGVARHSSFRHGPMTAARRLHETVRSMLSLTFGTPEEYDRTLDLIRGIHVRVHGTLGETVGRFPAGTRYSAEDPALVLWVHATLIESVVDFHDRVVAPVPGGDRDAYCLEAAEVAVALGADPERVPRTWQALLECLDGFYESGDIAVGSDAREVARAVLMPPFGWSIWPIARATRTITLGLLPDGVRAQYGFAWTGRDERAARANLGRVAAVHRMMPRALALWPEARGMFRDP